jgi:hypothetical protein
MARPREPVPPKPIPPRVELHPWWRGVLVVLGLAFAGLGIWTWVCPQQKTEFAPQAVNGTDTTHEVDDRSEVLSGGLLGIGALLIVFAANGRKIASVKVGGSEAEFDVAKTAEEKTKTKAKTANLPQDKQERAKRIARTEAVMKYRTGEDVNFDAIADEAIQTVQ